MKPLGTAGIALANSISSLVGLVFLITTLNKEVSAISWMSVIRGWTSASLASIPMGILAYIGAWRLDLGLFKGAVSTSARLFPLVGVCVLVYVAFLFLLRVPEAFNVKRVILRKINR
jgi:putative peptidoglycan lipid II flippase